ncbi:hypothetical protein H0H93_004858 [Arthromyces matolae]|nr:hypothetical protein H0H93_004858 [Arthromyces matolae]
MNGRFPLKSPSKVVSLRPGMTMTFTEREPLLQKKHDRVQSTTCGPLDIPPHRRQRILCAIWIAQFLSLTMAIVLPAISSEFQKSNEASWIGTSSVPLTSPLIME